MHVEQAPVLEALKIVKDPDLHRDIVSLGFIKDLKIDAGRVAFTSDDLFDYGIETVLSGLRQQFAPQERTPQPQRTPRGRRQRTVLPAEAVDGDHK